METILNRYLLILAGLYACGIVSGPSSLTGDWSVVGYAAPGISALSPEEADAWLGTKAYFRGNEAAFGDERCGDPTYTLSVLTEGEFGSPPFIDGEFSVHCGSPRGCPPALLC